MYSRAAEKARGSETTYGVWQIQIYAGGGELPTCPYFGELEARRHVGNVSSAGRLKISLLDKCPYEHASFDATLNSITFQESRTVEL